MRIKCKCGKVLSVPPGLEGKKILCPACRRAYRVPGGPVSAAVVRASHNPAIAPAPSPRESPSQIDLSSIDPLASPSELNLLEGLEAASPTILAFSTPGASRLEPAPADGKECPSCGKVWPKSAKICVACGINLKTGRSLIITDDSGLDESYTKAENSLRWISWIAFFGIYPVASEAFGTKHPHVVRTTAALTVLASVVCWISIIASKDHGLSTRNLMLWSGGGEPSANELRENYLEFEQGNADAFLAKALQLIRASASSSPQPNNAAIPDVSESAQDEPDQDGSPKAAGEKASAETEQDTIDPYEIVYEANDAAIIAAHRALPQEQQCYGQFRWHQLFTNAFLHAGLMHLAGNMLFLMVLGSRVNALIGNLYSIVLYPLLAVAGSVGHMLSMRDAMPHAALGASGAIMGLAGMYLVLFPVHKVHMAIWLRMGLFFGFRLYLKLFAVRGFWVVLFYIAFDVVYTVAGIEDGVAHWAHLGGFIAGVVFALVLILSRLVNARGGDILSAVFGRRAWVLVGKPR